MNNLKTVFLLTLLTLLAIGVEIISADETE